MQNRIPLHIGTRFRQRLEPANLREDTKTKLLLFCVKNEIFQFLSNIPSTEKKMAPTKPMNGPNSGTAAETPPIIKIIPARSKICELL